MEQHRSNLLDMVFIVIGHVSKRQTARLGNLLGDVAYAVDVRHRRIIERNLAFAFPQWSEAQRRQMGRRTFRNAATTFLEVCQTTLLSGQGLLQRLRIEGEENLKNAFKDSAGTIMISAHLGNWEMAHLAVSCYGKRPIVLVARRVRPKIMNESLNRLRRRFGSILIDKKNALSKMARSLNNGKILGLLIDQEPKHSRGVDVTFFDKPTTITPGPALLARRYGSPILPVFCVRETDGSLTLIVEPPIQPVKTDQSDDDMRQNMQAMTLAIERAIRAYPDQWFWFHKRWKHHFPHLYKEDLDRLKRRRAKRRKA